MRRFVAALERRGIFYGWVVVLAWAATVARRHHRRLLLTGSHDSVPAGRAFAERIGGSPGLEDRESQLVLVEVDRDLLARWQADAATSAAGFELIFWDDTIPEEDLVAFADLSEVMNTAPRGELDIEDQRMTPSPGVTFFWGPPQCGKTAHGCVPALVQHQDALAATTPVWN